MPRRGPNCKCEGGCSICRAFYARRDHRKFRQMLGAAAEKFIVDVVEGRLLDAAFTDCKDKLAHDCGIMEIQKVVVHYKFFGKNIDPVTGRFVRNGVKSLFTERREGAKD